MFQRHEHPYGAHKEQTVLRRVAYTHGSIRIYCIHLALRTAPSAGLESNNEWPRVQQTTRSFRLRLSCISMSPLGSQPPSQHSAADQPVGKQSGPTVPRARSANPTPSQDAWLRGEQRPAEGKPRAPSKVRVKFAPLRGQARGMQIGAGEGSGGGGCDPVGRGTDRRASRSSPPSVRRGSPPPFVAR